MTKQAAAVLSVMWNSKKEGEDEVNQDGLLDETNSTFQEYQWKQITSDELVSYLESLERLGLHCESQPV